MDKPLPSIDMLRETFHYNPFTGQFTYLQQRGPKRAGSPAGASIRGRACLFTQGGYCSAAAVAWAFQHGRDPYPRYVVPADGNPLNLRLSNLTLSDEPFVRSRQNSRAARKRPWKTQGIRYKRASNTWEAYHNKKLVARCFTKAEAIAAKRAARMSQEEQENA